MKYFSGKSFNGINKTSFDADSTLFVDCDFTNAVMEGANFSDAICVDCNFTNTDLYWCIAFRFKAIRCKFIKCDFRGGNIGAAVFFQCILSDCDFGPDNLGGTGMCDDIKFHECIITGQTPGSRDA